MKPNFDIKNCRCLNCKSKYLKGHWEDDKIIGMKHYQKWITDNEFFCDNCVNSLDDAEKYKQINDYYEKIAKPWKDKESLFCDTTFLENILQKKVLKGIECKEDYNPLN